MSIILTLTAADGATDTISLPDPVVIASDDMQVQITVSGAVTVYDRANGVDLGQYTDPQGQFIQNCVLCTTPVSGTAIAPTFSVQFRSDADGSRDEVVCELGDLYSAGPTNLGAYTVAIIKGGTTIATETVPVHYYRSRWRWQSAPRPIRTTPAALIAAKMIPNYDFSVLAKYSTPHVAVPAYTIMGMSSVTKDMGQTGERDDIGIEPEVMADYIWQQTPTSEANILAWAEASATVPWHFRDPATNAPLDVFTGNGATATTYVGAPGILVPQTSAGGIGVDQGHEPALCHLAFLLTGDPYYLEEMQFIVVSDVLSVQYRYRYTTFNGRYLAWPLRNAFYAAQCTPASVPSWMMPQSYFQQILDDGYLAAVQTHMANTTPIYADLHCIPSGGAQSAPGQPSGTYFDPWQEDFIAAVIALGVYMGFTEWQAALEWKIDCTCQRVNGTSGWNQSYYPEQSNFMPGAYLADAVVSGVTTIQVCNTPGGTDLPIGFADGDALNINYANNPNSTLVSGSATGTWTVPVLHSAYTAGRAITGPEVTSWSQAWIITAGVVGYPITSNGSLFSGNSNSVTYPSYARGALAIANRLGVAEAAAPFEWIDEQFTESLRQSGAPGGAWFPDLKWMIA